LVINIQFCVLFVCKCVLDYCHRVSTQMQFTNIYLIISILTGPFSKHRRGVYRAVRTTHLNKIQVNRSL